jgi:hypothetical protein
MSHRERLEELWQSTDATQAQAKSRKATVSFSLGLLSFFVCFLAGVPAVINGLLGLKEIRQSGGRLQGKPLAVSGIILGLLGSLVSGSVILYGVAKVQQASQTVSMA